MTTQDINWMQTRKYGIKNLFVSVIFVDGKRNFKINIVGNVSDLRKVTKDWVVEMSQ